MATLRSGILVLLLALVQVVTATAAPLSLRVFGLSAGHAPAYTATSANVTIPDPDAIALAFGGGIRVGLPFLGLHVGGHYTRHTGEADVGFTANFGEGDARFDLGANEFGGDLEIHVRLAPWSIQDPALGVGVGYVRIEIDGSLELLARADVDDALGTSIDAVRVYGLFRSGLAGRIGLFVRGGYTFADPVRTDTITLGRVTGTPASATIDHEGPYVAAGLDLRVF